MAFSSDTQCLYTGDSLGFIKVWNFSDVLSERNITAIHKSTVKKLKSVPSFRMSNVSLASMK